MIAISSYFKEELQPFKKVFSKADASSNSDNSKATNAPQNENKFDQILNTQRKKKKKGILFLESEKS